MNYKNLKEGDTVDCSFRSVFYPAKILKIDVGKTDGPYLVHYQGWKKRWDEWVPTSRFKGASDGSNSAKTKSSSKRSVSPLPVEEKDEKPVSPLPERTKHRGRPRKTEEIVNKSPVARAKSANVGSEKIKSVKKRFPSNSAVSSIKHDEEESDKNDDQSSNVQETNFPAFERMIEGNSVLYKNNTDGKTFKSLSEVKKYFKQKKMIFIESEFDFSLPSIPKQEPTQKKSTKKMSPDVGKSKRMKNASGTSSEQQVDQTERPEGQIMPMEDEFYNEKPGKLLYPVDDEQKQGKKLLPIIKKGKKGDILSEFQTKKSPARVIKQPQSPKIIDSYYDDNTGKSFPTEKQMAQKSKKKMSPEKKKAAKNKNVSESSNEQQSGPLEILDDIKQMQDVGYDTSKKLEIPIKRGRGRPPRNSNQTPLPKVARRGDRSPLQQMKEELEMEIAGDAMDVESKDNKATNKDDEYSLMMESSSMTGMNEFSTSSSSISPTFVNPNGRPMRSRKPNQRFNVLLSEMDALARQGRRRRYSSKHSATSGDEMLSDSNTAEEEHPLLVKIGTPKKKHDKDLSPSSPKRKKQGYIKKSKRSELKLTSGTMSDFESAPEFVEIQSRGDHSPQEHDDALPPVLGISSDHRNIRSQSLDPLPLVDQMCDALATTPSNETPPSMDHLISEFNASQERMQQHLTAAESLAAAPGLSPPPGIIRSEMKQEKKRVRKSVSKKAGKNASIDDDISPSESFKTSMEPKQKRKKEKKFSYTAHEEPPLITNEEIEEGLQTLEALEAQSLHGIKVSSSSSLPSPTGINVTQRASQVLLKMKQPTESRGRGRGARRSTTNVEIPLLHRESESSNDFSNVGLASMVSPPQQMQQQRQQHHQPTSDESTKFCYLPPEIMGDHCYGKSIPNSSYGAGASTVETPDGSVYIAEPSDVVAPPLHRVARGRPARFELLQRSPSPPPYKSSAFLGDSVGAYSYHRLETDYGSSSDVVGSSNVVLPASIMSGGQVPMLSDKLPANILEDDGDMDDDEEITNVDIS